MRSGYRLFLNSALSTLLVGSLYAQQTGAATDPFTIPPVIISATSDTATATVRLTLVEKPIATDIAAGLLENELAKERRIVPTLTEIAVTGRSKAWDVTLKVHQLIPFGESRVPLFYKGEKISSLRFLKVGLVLADPPDGGFIARQGSPLTLILKNQTGDKYDAIRVRLRFLDLDVCQAEPGKFGTQVNQATQPAADSRQPDCQDASQWTPFQVANYAPVTLRLQPANGWFNDPQTGFARPAKRKGLLTLHFIGEGTPPVIHEQNLPLEVHFEPGQGGVFWGVLRVVGYLLLGALLALCLRVVIPNYRRKRALREQLQEVAKSTRGISDAVPSVLRVLLRVERLTLDEIRKSRWVVGPSYPEAAQRVDQGLTTLKRRVELTRRLDAALSRKAILQQGTISPSRLDAIEKHLSMACEALKRDQLLEQDWVFLQQKLEAADKLLGEPSQEEKNAFDASLVQRWKGIAGFFGLNGQALVVPATLKTMEASFPSEQGLPKAGDTDGSQWVKTIGAVRADLQLSSLEILRDFFLLAPSAALSGEWQKAGDRLTVLLASPAIENLKAARLLLDELAEGVNVATLTNALRANEALIEWDPQLVEPNEKVRMRIRFRDEKLQTAAARSSIKCEWEFCDKNSQSWPLWAKTKVPETVLATTHQEQGWEIYHYFESGIEESDITVRFYTGGKVVTGQGTEPHVTRAKVRPQTRARTSNDTWERAWQAIPEALQIFAALLVPIAALAVAQAGEGATGRWWELAGIGFGSETIRNILTGTPPASSPAASPPK